MKNASIQDKEKKYFYWINLPPFFEKKSSLIRFRIRNVSSDKQKKEKKKKKLRIRQEILL
jgi:hypothetical protein